MPYSDKIQNLLEEFEAAFKEARVKIINELPKVRQKMWKGSRLGDFITTLDTTVCEIYTKWAKKSGVLLISEERADSTQTVRSGATKYIGILDSIDGTVNMVSNLPFGVNMALGHITPAKNSFKIGDIEGVFVADYLTEKTFKWCKGTKPVIIPPKGIANGHELAMDTANAPCYEVPDEVSYTHKDDKDSPMRQHRILQALRYIFPEAQRRSVDCTGLRMLEMADGNLLAYADVRRATQVWDTIPSIKFLLESERGDKILKGNLKPYGNDDVIIEKSTGGYFQINTDTGKEVIILRDSDYNRFINYFTKQPAFIVHGRATEEAHILSGFINEEFAIPCTILADKEERGMTTIFEKLLQHSPNVQFAVILITPDDVGKFKSDSNLKTRARQNVIFEAGLFLGLLGRDNVIIVNAGVEEIPSDIGGVIYAPSINNSDSAWRTDLGKKIKSIIKWRL
jgi:fructose-1,6-bisphosphatase/inositol monophosphatase family enzyme